MLSRTIAESGCQTTAEEEEGEEFHGFSDLEMEIKCLVLVLDFVK